MREMQPACFLFPAHRLATMIRVPKQLCLARFVFLIPSCEQIADKHVLLFVGWLGVHGRFVRGDLKVGFPSAGLFFLFVVPDTMVL